MKWFIRHEEEQASVLRGQRGIQEGIKLSSRSGSNYISISTKAWWWSLCFVPFNQILLISLYVPQGLKNTIPGAKIMCTPLLKAVRDYVDIAQVPGSHWLWCGVESIYCVIRVGTQKMCWTFSTSVELHMNQQVVQRLLISHPTQMESWWSSSLHELFTFNRTNISRFCWENIRYPLI